MGAVATSIDSGTRRHVGLTLGGLGVSEVEFGGRSRLAWHSHPRACTAVVLRGTVRKRFSRSVEEVGQGTVISMPADEPHEDLFGVDGATLVVVESECDGRELRCFRNWDATEIAHRIDRELAAPDAFTSLAVEGLALELAAVAARASMENPGPRWLNAARERFRDDPCGPPTLAELSREAGVEPAEFARSFRALFGESLGAYARRARLEWAADRLSSSNEPIATVAFSARFADQSHFTRAFKARFGVTPARYRTARR